MEIKMNKNLKVGDEINSEKQSEQPAESMVDASCERDDKRISENAPGPAQTYYDEAAKEAPLPENGEFSVGEKVCSIYFAGEVANKPQDTDKGKVYIIIVKDNDKRIDGKPIYLHGAELRRGNVPQFMSDYFRAKNRFITPETNREPTYGELVVGLSVDRSGIDAIDEVYRAKNLCAQLVDEAQFQLRSKEKEMYIASIEPTNRLSASLAVAELLKETIGKIIELKFLLVSAAVGNNDRA